MLLNYFRHQKGDKMTTTIQMRKKGSITIPIQIRQRYQLDENDPITLIDIGEGIFLSPKHAVLPSLVNEIENLRKEHNISLDELIQGVNSERKK
jgi:bifunctional DNA-binding transcriptional regulator/antitoxin component of YhaV-PrlF toxin-antitoxin module